MVFNPLELDEAATPAAVDRRIAAGEFAVAITMAAQVRAWSGGCVWWWQFVC